MKFNVRKCCHLEFVLYIRKYRQDKFAELAKGLYPDDEPDDLDDDQIQAVIDRMNPEDIHVYRVEYINNIFANIDDFIEDLYKEIDEENIYNKLYRDIIDSTESNDDKIAAIEQLDVDKDNYDLMCLRNNVPFYLRREDDISLTELIGNKIMLLFKSNQNEFDEFYVDFMLTPLNDNTTYK